MKNSVWLITLFTVTDGLLIPQPAFSKARRTNLGQTRNKAYSRRKLNDSESISASASSTADVSSNEDLRPGITAINESNGNLLENLSRLRDQSYFRLYSVDILANCEYMPQELFECYTESCEVYPVDEDEIPERIKDVDFEEHDFKLDGWGRWDMPSDDYYDLEVFPESYTGYDGSEVWNFIHNRICFKGYGYDDDHWKADFNKAVSGLHSMISAQIVMGIQEKIDNNEEFSDDEIWRNTEQEFNRRLSPAGETPLALENLYFCFMLLLQAALKAKPRLLEDCDAGLMDGSAAADLKAALANPLLSDPAVGIASKKLHDHAVKDSDSVEALWQARMRTRELMRIINCVQCNKCRLHGKVSVMGLSTAFQLLVGDKGEGGDLKRVHRVEVATLMCTLYKFARAVQFCRDHLKEKEEI